MFCYANIPNQPFLRPSAHNVAQLSAPNSTPNKLIKYRKYRPSKVAETRISLNKVLSFRAFRVPSPINLSPRRSATSQRREREREGVGFATCHKSARGPHVVKSSENISGLQRRKLSFECLMSLGSTAQQARGLP